MAKRSAKEQENRKIRYAVIGLGHIAQVAILPAFEHARENSELVALISNDHEKLTTLSKHYGVSDTYTYDEFDKCMESGKVDALYIALPNDLHKEYTVRAAQYGVHVLTEKPMANSEQECMEMIEACKEHNVKLMVAYRLHFDEANMRAVDDILSGKIGEPRFFNSSFALQVREGNIRTVPAKGGGPLYDIGIYCINAARYLFQDEPTEVVAMTASSSDPRFEKIPEMVSAILRFPNERLAAFTCSFGAADISAYRVCGTKGQVSLNPAYDYAEDLRRELISDGRKTEKEYPKHDQFAPELINFSNCILQDREPEPSGWEGLADLRIIEAINKSMKTGKPVQIDPIKKRERPNLTFVETLPAVEKPELVHAQSGSK